MTGCSGCIGWTKLENGLIAKLIIPLEAVTNEHKKTSCVKTTLYSSNYVYIESIIDPNTDKEKKSGKFSFSKTKIKPGSYFTSNNNLISYFKSYEPALYMYIDLANHTGIFKKWYTNGILNEVGKYKKGKLDGEQKIYNNKGELTALLKYDNGLLNGSCVFYEDGREMRKWYDNGINNGLTVEYFRNGMIKRKYLVSNGVKNGYYHEFDDLGNIKIKCHYIDGLKSGEYIEFKDRLPVKQVYYKNNRLLGREVEFTYYNPGELTHEQLKEIEDTYDRDYKTLIDGRIVVTDYMDFI
jgi:antitoxin component YwqK of YwqJK toxin-antitoxin module